MEFFRNNQGLTLVEMLITSAISGIVLLMTVTFMKMSFRTQVTFDEQLRSMAEDSLGFRSLHEDVAKSGASFEVLEKALSSGGNFFEYNPQANCTDCSRKIRLALKPQTGANESQSLDFVVDELRASSGFSPMNPLSFYDALTIDPQTGQANFAGLIQINFNTLKTRLENLRPNINLAENGRMLLFYSPERYAVSGGATRMPALVVRSIIDKDWKLITPSELGTQRHPASGVPFMGDGAIDTFFRSAPSVAGNGQFVLVKPVKLVRYLIVPDTYKQHRTARLVRAVYNGKTGDFPRPTVGEDKGVCAAHQGVLPDGCVVIATQVRGVEFSRSDIGTPVISFDIDFERFEFDKERS